MIADGQTYPYHAPGTTWDGSAAVFQVVMEELRQVRRGGRVLDAGCGNGVFTNDLVEAGFEAFGADPSESGIAIAQRACPRARFACLDLSVALPERAPFDAIGCIEVIEHVYSPQRLLARFFDGLVPGGRLILTTPYHGFVKNLAIVLTGKFDAHFDPRWEGGHIKFFTPRTLTEMMRGVGFEQVRFRGVGRVPGLWRSMVLSAQRPLDGTSRSTAAGASN